MQCISALRPTEPHEEDRQGWVDKLLSLEKCGSHLTSNTSWTEAASFLVNKGKELNERD